MIEWLGPAVSAGLGIRHDARMIVDQGPPYVARVVNLVVGKPREPVVCWVATCGHRLGDRTDSALRDPNRPRTNAVRISNWAGDRKESVVTIVPGINLRRDEADSLNPDKHSSEAWHALRSPDRVGAPGVQIGDSAHRIAGAAGRVARVKSLHCCYSGCS